MTDPRLDLSEMERLEAAATPGPWEEDDSGEAGPGLINGPDCIVGDLAIYDDATTLNEHVEANSALVCALRNAALDAPPAPKRRTLEQVAEDVVALKPVIVYGNEMGALLDQAKRLDALLAELADVLRAQKEGK